MTPLLTVVLCDTASLSCPNHSVSSMILFGFFFSVASISILTGLIFTDLPVSMLCIGGGGSGDSGGGEGGGDSDGAEGGGDSGGTEGGGDSDDGGRRGGVNT